MRKGTKGLIDSELDMLTTVLRVLSDKTRLRILLLLGAGEQSVTALSDTLELSQPNASHHLGLLRMCNLIANRRDGKQVFYALNGHVDMTPNGSLKIGTASHHVTISHRA